MPLVSSEIRTVNAANIEARKAYKPDSFKGKVTLFRASDQPPGILQEPTLGWKDLAVGEIEIHEIPGNHVSIIQSPVLTKCLKDCLNNEQTSH